MTEKNNNLTRHITSVAVFITIFILIVAAGILFTALVTFDANDPAWSHNNGGEVKNALGAVGAWYSDLSFSLLGKLGYLIPIALSAFAVHAWLEKGIDKELLSWRLFMVLTAILSGSVLWAKHDSEAINTVAQTGGGALGAWLTVGLEKSIQSVPVIMAFSLIIFGISLSLLFNFPWFKIMDWVGRGISKFFAMLFSGFATAREKKKTTPTMKSTTNQNVENYSAPEPTDPSVQQQIDIVKELSSEESNKESDQRSFTIDRYNREEIEENNQDILPPRSLHETSKRDEIDLNNFRDIDSSRFNESQQTEEERSSTLRSFGFSHPLPKSSKTETHDEQNMSFNTPTSSLVNRKDPVDMAADSNEEIPLHNFSANSHTHENAEHEEDKAEPAFFDFNKIRTPNIKIPQNDLSSLVAENQNRESLSAQMHDTFTAEDNSMENRNNYFAPEIAPEPNPTFSAYENNENNQITESFSVTPESSHESLASKSMVPEITNDFSAQPTPTLDYEPFNAVGNTSEQPINTSIAEDSFSSQPIHDVSNQATSFKPNFQQTDKMPVEATPTAPISEPASMVPPERKTTATIGKAFDKEEFVDEIIDRPHEFPSIELLDTPPTQQTAYTEDALAEMAMVLETTLKQFNVVATVMHVSPGPVITRFEIELAPGIQAKKITGLSQDLARALAVSRVRVEEVIVGSSYVGLEVPNQAREMVYFKDVVRSKAFQNSESPLTISLGSDTSGKPVVADLMKMPHALVAGTTGSGKSVCINVMLLSMLYKAAPKDLRLILVDPKMLEMSMYEDIPHLLTPVITDMNEAENALTWAVGEMERRYQLMAALKVRKIDAFNEHVDAANARGEPIKDPLWQPDESVGYTHHPSLERLPFIVIVIDELADMMMVVGKQVEQLIARLTQKARAAGIHVVLATQRPSTDVLTGLIKANVPTRIAFQVSSGTDSRVIIDSVGAEKLLGHGDMLFVPPGASHPQRLHGAFVGDAETDRITDFLRSTGQPDYINGITGKQDPENLGAFGAAEAKEAKEDADPLYDEAVQLVLQTGKASISSVQRQLRIGYNRAARMIEDMQEQGIVSEPKNGVRRVLAAPPPKDVI